MTALWGALLAGLAVWWWLPDQGRLGRVGGRGAPRAAVAPWWGRAVGLVGRLPRRAEVKAQEARARALPEILELMACALAAGVPPRRAVAQVCELVGPVAGAPLRQVDARTRMGLAEEDSWEVLAQDPVWAEPAREMARAVRSGTGSVEALRRCAQDARGARRDLLTRRARTVGVRSVIPLMCCFLPAFLLVGVVPVIAGIVTSGVLR